MGVFKPNPNLNGRTYSAASDPNLNVYQQDPEVDVYASIPQDNGPDLPPLAFQWKEDARRRFKHE